RNCIGCHMPQRVWMNVHFHLEDDQYVPPATRHEHRIGVYPVARQEVLLAWYRARPDAKSAREAARLTEDLVKHWLAAAENRRRDHRFLAAIGALREALRLDPRPQLRHLLQKAEAVQAGLDADWVGALQLIDDAKNLEAISMVKRVLEVKPDLARAHGK